MVIKRLLPSILIILLSLSFLPTHAQNGVLGTIYCGDLSEADCDLIKNSVGAMQTVSSASLEADIKVQFAGIELEPGVDSGTMSLQLNGPIEADFAGFYQLIDGYQDALVEVLDNPADLDAEALINVASIASLIQSLTGAVDVELDFANAETGPITVSTRVIMDNGIIYLDQETVAAQFPSIETSEARWIGLDMFGLLSQQVESNNVTSLGAVAGTTFGVDEFAMLMGIADTELVDLFYDSNFLSEFITVERLGDQAIDGQTIAVFQTTTDFNALLRSPRFADALVEFITLIQENDPDTTEEVNPADLQLLLSVIAIMIPNFTYTTELWIGVDDNLQYHNSVDVFLEMDPTLLDDTGESQPLMVTFSLNVDLREFNTPINISIPTDVELLAPEDLD